MAPERVLFFDGDRAPDGEDRVLGNYAARNGALYICGEFGGGSTVSPDGLRMVQHCLARLLVHIGALSIDGARQFSGTPNVMEPPAQRATYSMDDPDLFIHAQRPGFFAPAFRLGEVVERDQLAGYLYDNHDFWQKPIPVRFARGGLAVCQRTFAQVQIGDCLGHLARVI